MDMDKPGLNNPRPSGISLLGKGDSSSKKELCKTPHLDSSSSLTLSLRPVADAKSLAMAPADVMEFKSYYVYTIDVPGLKSKDLKVRTETEPTETGYINKLVVTGERKRQVGDVDGKELSKERHVGKFKREFKLPEGADGNSVKAACKEGVLTVIVKKFEPLDPRIITIHSMLKSLEECKERAP